MTTIDELKAEQERVNNLALDADGKRDEAVDLVLAAVANPTTSDDPVALADALVMLYVTNHRRDLLIARWAELDDEIARVSFGRPPATRMQ